MNRQIRQMAETIKERLEIKAEKFHGEKGHIAVVSVAHFHDSNEFFCISFQIFDDNHRVESTRQIDVTRRTQTEEIDMFMNGIDEILKN